MKVRKINRPEEEYCQCAQPASALREVGWKGYREGRSRQNGKDPSTCMREGQWEIDGKMFCTQHAGMIALEHLSKENTK